jgi:hypothetical protein
MWEKMWCGAYGDMLEKQAKDFQWVKFKLSVKEKSKLNDHGVVIKEGIIKLHEHDTRRDYREKWLQKCSVIARSDEGATWLRRSVATPRRAWQSPGS